MAKPAPPFFAIESDSVCYILHANTRGRPLPFEKTTEPLCKAFSRQTFLPHSRFLEQNACVLSPLRFVRTFAPKSNSLETFFKWKTNETGPMRPTKPFPRLCLFPTP